MALTPLEKTKPALADKALADILADIGTILKVYHTTKDDKQRTQLRQKMTVLLSLAQGKVSDLD